CNGVEPPGLFASSRIVGADEAFFFPVRGAIAKPLDQLSLGDERATAGAVAPFRPIADDSFPDRLAGPCVEGDQVRIARCRKNLVVIHRYPAKRSTRAARPAGICPND